MKHNSPTKPRVVNYVTPEELKKIKSAAQQAGLRTPAQVTGMWIRQKIAASAK